MRERTIADEDLVDRAITGDSQAIGELCEMHRCYLDKLFCHKWNLESCSEDMIQEVYLHVVKSIHTFKKQCQFTTWLYGIARGVALAEFSKLDPERAGGGKREIVTRHGKTWALETVSLETVSRRISRYEETRLVNRLSIAAAIDRLPDDVKNAIIACDIEGHTTYVHARVVGVSRQAVVSRLCRGHKTLKAVFGSTANMVSDPGGR